MFRWEDGCIGYVCGGNELGEERRGLQRKEIFRRE